MATYKLVSVGNSAAYTGFVSVDTKPAAGPFETADDMTDVTFIVEDRKLYFYKMVLTLWSPVFKAMFTDDFKEKSARVIPLPGKKYADVEVFFKQIHPVHSAEAITDKTLLQILPLADEYQVDSIRKKCEQYIGHQIDRKQALSNDELLFYLRLCEIYRLTTHTETLVTLGTSRKVSDLERSPQFKCVPQTATSDMLRRRCVQLENFLDTDVQPVLRTVMSLDLLAIYQKALGNNEKPLFRRLCNCSSQSLCYCCFDSKIKAPAKEVLNKIP